MMDLAFVKLAEIENFILLESVIETNEMESNVDLKELQEKCDWLFINPNKVYLLKENSAD